MYPSKWGFCLLHIWSGRVSILVCLGSDTIQFSYSVSSSLLCFLPLSRSFPCQFKWNACCSNPHPYRRKIQLKRKLLQLSLSWLLSSQFATPPRSRFGYPSVSTRTNPIWLQKMLSGSMLLGWSYLSLTQPYLRQFSFSEATPLGGTSGKFFKSQCLIGVQVWSNRSPSLPVKVARLYDWLRSLRGGSKLMFFSSFDNTLNRLLDIAAIPILFTDSLNAVHIVFGLKICDFLLIKLE